MKIISINVNAWAHILSNESFGNRLNRILNYVREASPDIICLQEMLAGKHKKYINQLRRDLPYYEVILPQFDIDQHWKSVISVICIKKSLLTQYDLSVLTLPGFELTNRYNYISLGNDCRLLNIHIPQTSEFSGAAKWYVQERLRLSAVCWEAVEKECFDYRGKMILVGDMNENAHSANIVKLIADGYTRIGFYDPDIIDHVLLSPAADLVYRHRRVRVDDTVSTVDMLTDHPMVVANIA